MKLENLKIIKIFQDSKDQSKELIKVQILKIKMIQIRVKFKSKIIQKNIENKDKMKMKMKVMELQCLQIYLGLAKIS